jgi:hypothetical protein
MNIALKGAVISFTVCSCLGIASGGIVGPDRCLGQTQPPAPPADTTASHSSAQSEAGEPRAATSPDVASGEEQSPAVPAEGTRPQAPQAKREEAPAKAAGKAEKTGKPAAVDKLELQTATVTGDREQPKVMYIVPWKKSDIGDLSGKPMNSLLDEALAPIDRDEFKREVVYYQAVRADASQNGAPGKAPAAPAGSPR